MRVTQLAGVEGAKRARGLTVVVDIMRAATVEAYAFGQGTTSIITVSTKEDAFSLKEMDPELLLMGEERGIKVPEFDFSNSPSEIAKINLSGKRLVHRSSSGTQGLAHAIHAEALIFGSFVTCSSIGKFINDNAFSEVSIVSMDREDSIFAKALEQLLTIGSFDKEKARKDLRNDSGVQWYFDPAKKDFPAEDIEYALDFDRFPFVCLVENIRGVLTVKPEKI